MAKPELKVHHWLSRLIVSNSVGDPSRDQEGGEGGQGGVGGIHPSVQLHTVHPRVFEENHIFRLLQHADRVLVFPPELGECAPGYGLMEAGLVGVKHVPQIDG